MVWRAGTLMSILSADVLVVKTGSCGNPMALVEALSAVLAGEQGYGFAPSRRPRV